MARARDQVCRVVRVGRGAIVTARIDRRFLDRRRHVREDGARRQLRWGIALVVVAALAAVITLAFRSPLLAVREVSLSGVTNAAVADVLESHDIAAGVPTLGVRASAVEDAIEADPWVARASVRVTWPGTVAIAVLEHVPAAWMDLDRGWMLVSATGVLLERGDPPHGAPRVRMDAAGGVPGERVDGPRARAALEFLGSLPVALTTGAEVTRSPDGLVATVAGHLVILGAPTDMRAKAIGLAALLEDGIPEGSIVNMVAPAFPAVASPSAASDLQPEVEGVHEASSTTSG